MPNRTSTTPWRWYDRIAGAIVGGLLMLSIVGAAVGVAMAYLNSVRYLQPIELDVTYLGGEWIAELTRMTPRGIVQADWTIEAAVVGNAMECRAEGSSVFQPIYADETIGRRANVARFPMSESLRPCLENSRPVTIYAYFNVIMFGIKHRAVSLEATLE